MNLKKTGVSAYVEGAFSRASFRLSRFSFSCLIGILSMFTIHYPLATVVYAADPGVEFGVEDDLTILGLQGGAADPDVEIKGFTVFGSTQTSYSGIASGPGNVVVNGILSVSSGAYFAANSTFTSISVSSITTASAGVVFTTNVFVTSGNVGIGTSNPGVKLEVVGNNVVKSGGLTLGTCTPTASGVILCGGQKLLLQNPNGGNPFIYGTDVGGGQNIQFRDSADANTRFYVDMLVGNVGIGTTAPNQKLEIGSNGGVGFSGGSPSLNSADKKLYSPADGDIEWMTNNAAGAHGFAISNQGTKAVYLNTNGNSYLNGGNVGISTGAPQARLDVLAEGSAATDFVQIWRNSGGTIVSSMSATGVLYPQTAGGGSQTPWTSAINAAGFTLNGNNTVSGNLTLDSTSNATKGYVLLNPTGGSVGIGTTNPAQTLDIAGGMARIVPTYGTPDAGYSTFLKMGYDTSDSYIYTVRRSGTTGFLEFTGSQTGSIGYTFNGNVGIGTTAPAAPLDVRSAPGAGGAQGAFRSNSGTNVSYGGLNVANSAGNAVYLTLGDASYTPATYYAKATWASMAGSAGVGLRFGANTRSDDMVINTSGNVGIGTTAPAVGLHMLGGASGVREEIRIETTAASNAARLRLINNSGGNWYVGAGASDGSSNFQISAAGVAATGINIKTDGNVGIGTTGPGANLDVSGSAPAIAIRDNRGAAAGNGGVLNLQALDNGAATKTMAQIAASSLNNLGVSGHMILSTLTSSVLTERMRIQNDGNVGIGTTNPGVKFDVAGDIRATGAILNAYLSMSGNIVASRAFGTQYQAPSNRWRDVSVSIANTGANANIKALIGSASANTEVAQLQSVAGTTRPQLTFSVPPNWYYQITTDNANGVKDTWYENDR